MRTMGFLSFTVAAAAVLCAVVAVAQAGWRDSRQPAVKPAPPKEECCLRAAEPKPCLPTITDVHRKGCAALCEGVGAKARYLYSDSAWPTIYCVCTNGRHFHMGATFEWLESE